VRMVRRSVIAEFLGFAIADQMPHATLSSDPE
jgi:hypothetical protein